MLVRSTRSKSFGVLCRNVFTFAQLLRAPVYQIQHTMLPTEKAIVPTRDNTRMIQGITNDQVLLEGVSNRTAKN